MNNIEDLDFAKNVTPDRTLPQALSSWRTIEVSPVKRSEPGSTTDAMEVCNKEEAEFWSVYLNPLEGPTKWIADLPNEEMARDFAALLLSAINYIQTYPIDIRKH